MRKIALGMALASTALASPALARDGQWYVEVDGGVMLLEDMDFDIATNATTTVANAVTIDSEYGYDFGGIVGYDFGGFRLEAEASWREADPDTLFTSVPVNTTSGVAVPIGAIGGTGVDFVGGDTNALSFMLNGMIDFGPDDGLQGFVGGGVGVSRVEVDASINANGPGIVDDSDTNFAWQVLAGVRAPLTDNWDVGLKYRFFNVDDVELVDSAGRGMSTRFRSHSLLGTFTYNFGGEEPIEEVIPTPLPPPPPPPPPVARPVCNKGPYIVFFDWDKSNITPEAATILDSAITAYANCDRVPIMLAGHTDRSGSTQYNVGLSERRNASVRSYLAARGIPDGSMTSQAFGESNPRVPTADGVRELQNRRVEITYGPGSGM